jgi:hypothetical protein
MNRGQTRARWRERFRGEITQGSARPQSAKSASSHLPAAVSVRIEQLHLQSVSHRDGRRVADALQHELSSLLASGNIPNSWLQGQTIETARLQDVRLRPGAKTQVVGEQLARALLRAGDGPERR